jgi:hypothetical protein
MRDVNGVSSLSGVVGAVPEASALWFTIDKCP